MYHRLHHNHHVVPPCANHNITTQCFPSTSTSPQHEQHPSTSSAKLRQTLSTSSTSTTTTTVIHIAGASTSTSQGKSTILTIGPNDDDDHSKNTLHRHSKNDNKHSSTTTTTTTTTTDSSIRIWSSISLLFLLFIIVLFALHAADTILLLFPPATSTTPIWSNMNDPPTTTTTTTLSTIGIEKSSQIFHHHSNESSVEKNKQQDDRLLWLLVTQAFTHLFLPSFNNQNVININSSTNSDESLSSVWFHQRVSPVFQEQYNRILSRAMTYINIVDHPSCSMPVHTPFMTKTKLHRFEGQCFDQHTTWSKKDQMIKDMVCTGQTSHFRAVPPEHSIPVYFDPSGDMIFHSPDLVRRSWKLFPSQPLIAKVLSEFLKQRVELSDDSDDKDESVGRYLTELSTFITDNFALLVRTLSSQLVVDTSQFTVVHTACVDTKRELSIHNYFTQVVRNESMVQEKQRLLKQWKSNVRKSVPGQATEAEISQPPNIHVVLIDGASRDFFYRHFPHTSDYLSQMKQMNADFEVLDFSNNMVLGCNSIPNMYAFITGRSVKDNETSDSHLMNWHANHPNDRPFIWETLNRLGYVTSVGEDAGDSGIGNIYGLKNHRRTFDTYPAYHLVSHRVNHDQAYFFNYNARVCPCVGQQFMSDVVLDWTRDHVTKYHDLPNFILSASHEVHDAVSRQPLTLDPNVKKHLQWYVESGMIKNTVLVLLADHGIHYGPIYANEKQARWEHENPFMTLIAPKHMVTDTLRSNLNKLLSLKDLHMTLRDFASFPVRTTLSDVRTDAKSLLYDSLSADRSCSELQTHPDFSTSCGSSKRQQLAHKRQ